MTVRLTRVVFALIVAVTLAACTSSTTATVTTQLPPRLPTSPKALVVLQQKAMHAATLTLSATYRVTSLVNGGGSVTRTIYVAQRARSMIWMQPAPAARATSEFLSTTGTAGNLATCRRVIPGTPWLCQSVGPGNIGSMLLSQDNEAGLLANALYTLTDGKYRAVDDGFMVVAGRELACLRFGSTGKACFFPNGLIGYFYDTMQDYPGRVTMLSYSTHIPAKVFSPPAKVIPLLPLAGGTQAHPVFSPNAVAGADGYLWLTGSYYGSPNGSVGALFLSTDLGRTWQRLPTPPQPFFSLQFVNRSDGYAYWGNSLYWTDDGRRVWHVALSALQPAQPSFVTISAGHVFALVQKDCYPSGVCNVLALGSAAVNSDDWTTRPLPLTEGEVSPQVGYQVGLTAFGARVWIFDPTRASKTLVFVSDNDGRSFSRLASTGLDGADCSATASSMTTLWGFCNTDATSSFGYPVRSTDGGRHFLVLTGWYHGAREDAAGSSDLLPISPDEAIFEPDAGPQLWLTRDGGKRFSAVLQFPAPDWYSDIGIADADTWLAVGLSPNYGPNTNVLNLTTDGGKTWHRLSIPKL